MSTTSANPGGAPPAPDARGVWAEVLQDYRTSLTGRRDLLDRVHTDEDLQLQDDAGPVFVPPAGLPALPSTLVDEARALDAETAELLATARELMSQLKPPNGAPVHRSILAAPSPSQMDTRL